MSPSVIATSLVTPLVRRVTLGGGPVRALDAHPGLTVKLVLPLGDVRHYTVRSTPSDDRIEVDVVLHGHGPGARWATDVAVGDGIGMRGPKSRRRPPVDLDWYLFAADPSALPAASAFAEEVGDRALLLAEVSGPDEEQPTTVPTRWVRQRRRPGESLRDAVASWTPPPGRGLVWAAGETSAMRSLREHLREHLPEPSTYEVRGYWKLGEVNVHEQAGLR